MKRTFSQPRTQNIKIKNQHIYFNLIFWFYRSFQKAIATSKIHDEQQLGDPVKTQNTAKDEFFQKAMTPPIPDILGCPHNTDHL